MCDEMRKNGNRINYQRLLDETLAGIVRDGKNPSLLLHACCAPCSSYVLEYLSQYFDITILYYNPNIFPREEYEKRVAEICRLVKELPVKHPVEFLEGPYEPERFFEMAREFADMPEGGERCFRCYRLRLGEAAKAAAAGGFDYFTTTLSISPLKNAEKLNEIGRELSEQYGVPYLYSDFKKKNGYKRSIELSAKYHLYRQNFCGCVYSKTQRMEIRYVQLEDKEFWYSLDRHLPELEFVNKVRDKRGYILFDNKKPVGLLRYNLFWDNTPFCSMLFIDGSVQGRGYGKALMEYWEKDMKAQGYGMLLTSTQVDENAQHFYRKLGYKDCGGFVIDIPEYAQPMEMFMIKKI